MIRVLFKEYTTSHCKTLRRCDCGNLLSRHIVYLLVAPWFPSYCITGYSRLVLSKEEKIIRFALESGKSEGEQAADMSPDDTVLPELMAESIRA